MTIVLYPSENIIRRRVIFKKKTKLALAWRGCRAQRLHLHFSPSGPGFDSRQTFFLLRFVIYSLDRGQYGNRTHLVLNYARDFANAVSAKD